MRFYADLKFYAYIYPNTCKRLFLLRYYINKLKIAIVIIKHKLIFKCYLYGSALYRNQRVQR